MDMVMDDKSKLVCLAWFYANRHKELDGFDFDVAEEIAPLQIMECIIELFESRYITISKTDSEFKVHYYKITDKGIKEYKRLKGLETSEKWRRVRGKYWWVLLVVTWIGGIFTPGLSEMVSRYILKSNQQEQVKIDTVVVYRQRTDTLYLQDSLKK